MDYRTSQNPIFPQGTFDFCDYCNQGCVKTGVQYADISTPVNIAPCVKIGEIITEYLGEPEVCCTESKCKNACELVILQNIRIKIPIQYNISACVGESVIDCASDDPCCE